MLSHPLDKAAVDTLEQEEFVIEENRVVFGETSRIASDEIDGLAILFASVARTMWHAIQIYKVHNCALLKDESS